MKTLGILGMVAFTSAAALAAAAGPASAGERLTMKPKAGISFDVGTKRAVGYYLAEGGICNLTVLMADTGLGDEVKGAATRVSVPVIPKKAARIDTAEGKTLEFSCAPSAQAMTVNVLEKVAYAAPKS